MDEKRPTISPEVAKEVEEKNKIREKREKNKIKALFLTEFYPKKSDDKIGDALVEIYSKYNVIGKYEIKGIPRIIVEEK